MFLERIRERSKGLVGALIVGLIAITFALFGIDQYLGGGSAPPVASVNGADISAQQFQQALLQRQQQMRDMFGGNVPPAMLEPATLREPVLQGLIQSELLVQMTDQFGYGISDNQVASAIREIPAFQGDGKFDADKYDRLLTQQRRSKASFEAQLRSSLRLEQFGDVFQSSAFLPDSMLQDFLRLRDQQRHIRYVLIEKQGFASEVNIDDAEIKAYYDKNTAQFMTPEQVKLEYLILDEKTLADNVSVDEQAVRDVYENEVDRFKAPESRFARHILLKVPEAAAIQVVEEKAQGVYERIMAGESFEVLAGEYSEDDLSSQQGGELGEIIPGDMAADLEKLIFSATAGEVSAPAQTAQGIHIVKVDSVRGGGQQSFDEVRVSIETELRAREAENLLVEKSEQLMTLTFEESGTLDVAADALGISTQTTDWITRSGGNDDLVKDPRILQAAFSNDVLNDGRNSDVIAISDGRQTVVRIAEHNQPAPEMFELVSERIRQQLSDEKQQQLAQEKAASMLQTLESSTTDLDSLGDASGLSIETIEDLKRDNQNIPGEIVKQAFRMTAPASGSHNFSSTGIANGSQVVIALIAIDNTPPGTDQAELDTITNVMGGSYSQRELEAVFKAMEERADIKVNRDNINTDQQ